MTAILDIPAVKQALSGRWAEVLSSLGGIDAEILDGRNHPCPKCGGTDRFRLIDREAGALFCNQCFSKENGDGFAALQWLSGKSFPEVLHDLNYFLGNGNGHTNTSHQNEEKLKTNGQTFPTAQAAIADLERRHGKRSALWTYHNAAGEPVGVIVRWDTPEGKDIRPVSLVDGKWIIGGMPEPKPLYCLPELPDARRVYATEGEKAADAARSIGLTATTTPHGAQAPHKANWTPLAGKEIIILPDNDAAGKAYCEAVKAILAKLQPAPTVKVVTLPGLPEKGDICEWIENHGDSAEPETMRAEIEALVSAVPIATATVEKYSIEFPAMTCAELMVQQFVIQYLIQRILVRLQPLIIAGPKKALKTTLIIALALALATGKSFLGFFEVFAVVAVGIMTGESGLATIKETIQRIAAAMGIDPNTIENIFISEKVPQLDSVAHLEALRRFIIEHALKVLILDPAYMMMSGADAGNLFAQGQLLRGITELCQELGCTLIICHHTKRNIGRGDQYSPPELEDIAWAGFQEWARQWLLVARREAYQPGTGLHRLWMTSGGSAGHGGLWALNVSEGTSESDGGRYWQVDVLSADEAHKQITSNQQSKREQVSQETLEADKKRVINTIVKYPEGETKSTIQDRSGIRSPRFNIALAALLEDGCIVDCEIQKSNRKMPYKGYKIKESNPL